MMYKNYIKQKDIVIVPKNNDKHILKSLNKGKKKRVQKRKILSK